LLAGKYVLSEYNHEILITLPIATDAAPQTILEMYRAVIISVPSTVGLLSLILLFGAAAGYVIVAKRIITQARSLKQSNLIRNEPLDTNLDTNKLLPAA
jgi:hypothetical protein